MITVRSSERSLAGPLARGHRTQEHGMAIHIRYSRSRFDSSKLIMIPICRSIKFRIIFGSRPQPCPTLLPNFHSPRPWVSSLHLPHLQFPPDTQHDRPLITGTKVNVSLLFCLAIAKIPADPPRSPGERQASAFVLNCAGPSSLPVPVIFRNRLRKMPSFCTASLCAGG